MIKFFSRWFGISGDAHGNVGFKGTLGARVIRARKVGWGRRFLDWLQSRKEH